jgi:hypothetical protein
MANPGRAFKLALINEIRSWAIPGLELYEEVKVGNRFVGRARHVDIVLKVEGTNKTFGIEAKIQTSGGTADQKLFYTLDDCIGTPIPTVIAFAGEYIGNDIKSKLVLSGYGIEIDMNYDSVTDTVTILDSFMLKQRAKIELGLDWLADQASKRVF